MAYTVNKTNSSASPNSYTVNNSVVNTETDLSLIGKGYAGYGETIAENFLHLLENFSNTTAPSKPILGQLWWDSTNTRLKVYSGSAFVPAGSNAPYQSAAPSAMVAGDLWIDSASDQLYLYTGSASVLVGPPTAGTTNGFTYHTILDSTDVSQKITKWFNDGNLIAIISEDTFTPKVAISGFASIKKGITLTTAIADTKFQGTATDSDALGGVAAANYLRSNANDTTSGTLGIVTDSGMTVGADNDLSLTVDATGVVIANTTQNTDIEFKVNDGGATVTVMHIDGASSRIGILNTAPTTALDVTGTATATAFAGNLTGNVTGTVTGASSLNLLLTGGTLTGTVNSQSLIPTANNTYNLGSSGLKYNTVYATTHTSTSADLSEVYESDSNYDTGTVVIFGGDNEVTQSTIAEDTRVAGVISENPAYIMNDGSEGQTVALAGKVPCRVQGTVLKGDLLTTSGAKPGCAKKAFSPKVGSIIGKAMEDKNDAGESLILISVGRQ